MRPERLGNFNKHFVRPVADAETNRHQFELQKTVALNDLDALQRNMLCTKDCQFRLILTALPLLIGLVGSAFGYAIDLAKQHKLILLLPPICAYLSGAMLAVFLQKAESVRRYTAFSMLLHRYLSFGSFPPCYRGWYDAYENYIHMIRHGFGARYVIKPFREDNFRHRIPPDAFVWFGVSFLAAIPIVSIILMWVMASGMEVDIGHYTALVAVTTVIGAMFGIWFCLRFYELTRGRKTFRYLVVLFSKILKHTPPFDPYKNDKLE